MEIRLSEIKTRYGMLSVPNSGGDVIGRHLARYGEWGWDEVCFIASILPSKGARVLDVGAFVGTFGIGLSQLRNLDFLGFVEANANIADFLNCNIQRIFTEEKEDSQSNCGLKPIVIEAMMAAPGALLLPGVGSLKNLGSTSFSQSVSSETTVTAPPPGRIVTLAELRSHYGDFDLIKLDAEGMELDILHSDAPILSQGNTALWIECNENHRSLEIMDLLLSWELDIYYFAFPAHNPDNIYNDRTPIFPYAYEAGLLIAPSVRPALDDVLQAHHCILRPVASIRDLKDAMWHTPRWGMREWHGATHEGIVALAGRSLKGEQYESYLQPGAEHPHSAEVEKLLAGNAGRMPDLSAQLEKARQQKSDDENRISSLTAQLEKCRQAETLASDRLALLETERQHSTEVEELLAFNSAKVLSLLAQIEEIQELKLELEKALEQRLSDEKQMASLSAELEQCRREAVDHRNRALSMENSLSWKITKPLRQSIGRNSRLGGWLRYAKHKASALSNRQNKSEFIKKTANHQRISR
jgi:hypothetical protein